MILCNTACSASSVGAGTSTKTGAPSVLSRYTPFSTRQCRATLRHVEPHGALLQSLPALEEIECCAARDGNHATHLRSVFNETRNAQRATRNAQSMVQESARALRSGPAGDVRPN